MMKMKTRLDLKNIGRALYKYLAMRSDIVLTICSNNTNARLFCLTNITDLSGHSSTVALSRLVEDKTDHSTVLPSYIHTTRDSRSDLPNGKSIGLSV